MKKYLLLFAVVLFMLSISLTASAAEHNKTDWKFVTSNGDVDYYVDMSDITMSQDKIMRFWSLVDDKPKDRVIMYYIASDMSNKRFRFDEAHIFYPDGTMKRFYQPGNWNQFEEESVFEEVINFMFEENFKGKNIV